MGFTESQTYNCFLIINGDKYSMIYLGKHQSKGKVTILYLVKAGGFLALAKLPDKEGQEGPSGLTSSQTSAQSWPVS